MVTSNSSSLDKGLFNLSNISLKNANIEAKDKKQRTPLACKPRYLPIVQYIDIIIFFRTMVSLLYQ